MKNFIVNFKKSNSNNKRRHYNVYNNNILDWNAFSCLAIGIDITNSYRD